MKRRAPVPNLVVISDTHVGCRLALCHPDGFEMDDGGFYKPSAVQLKLWAMWRYFWDVFVPDATRGEPFAVCMNGDAIDGSHHGSTTQISHNIQDQRRHAQKILSAVVDQCSGRYYHIRGTDAHVGQSGEDEEALARSLDAIPNKEGQHARHDLWFWILGKGRNQKKGGSLGHILHHVGSTGSQAYEATALHKEYIESCIEAAKSGQRPPSWIVRSHRHRYMETKLPMASGQGIAVVTPAWQGKTSYAWRIAGARLSAAQFGGIVVRQAPDGEVFVRPMVWHASRSEAEGL